MSEIWDVEMGYVTSRRGARLHLVVADGRVHCKSGSGVIISSRKARGSDAPHTCKKCREALRTRLVDVLSISYEVAIAPKPLRPMATSPKNDELMLF